MIPVDWGEVLAVCAWVVGTNCGYRRHREEPTRAQLVSIKPCEGVSEEVLLAPHQSSARGPALPRPDFCMLRRDFPARESQIRIAGAAYPNDWLQVECSSVAA